MPYSRRSRNTSSEYLGWTERKPEQASRIDLDPTSFDRNAIPGGPATQSYESYIRGLFRPNEESQSNHNLPPSFAPPSAQGSQSSRNLFGQGPTGPEQPNFQNPHAAANKAQHVLTATGPQKVSAAAMLRMEEQLGKDALDDTYDDELWKSPLDSIYAELGLDSMGLGSRSNGLSSVGSSSTRPSPLPRSGTYSGLSPSSTYHHPNYEAYTPKSSREYFSTLNSMPPASSSYRSSNLGTYRLGGVPSSLRRENSTNSGKTFKEKSDEDWRKTNRQMLVDYQSFNSSPLSPYMYQHHPYVHSQDSRIVGSNFVQLTTRPRDRFLEKIDKTLAEVRSSPRYTFVSEK